MKHVSYCFPLDEPVMSVLHLSILRDLVENRGYTLKGCKGTYGSNPRCRKISRRQFLDVIDASLRPKPLQGIGFQFGERLNLAAAGTPGQLFMAAPTLEKALRLFLEYYPLLSYSMDIDSHFRGNHSRLEFGHLYPSSASLHVQWFLTETIIYSILTCARLMTGEQLSLSHLAVSYPEPPHSQLYAQYFGCPVTFDSETTVVKMDFLHKKVITANEPVMQLKEWECQRAIRNLRKRLCIREQIIAILKKMQPDIPSQDAVAEHLNVSQSSLYRKLKIANTSYQKIVDEFRCTQALDYLNNSELSVSQIAENLGFSDSSNFRRAFKKWTGTTPSELRSGL